MDPLWAAKKIYSFGPRKWRQSRNRKKRTQSRQPPHRRLWAIRFVMELFSRRRWTTGSAQHSNTYGMLPCMLCIIILGFVTNTTAYHLGQYSLNLLVLKSSMGLSFKFRAENYVNRTRLDASGNVCGTVGRESSHFWHQRSVVESSLWQLWSHWLEGKIKISLLKNFRFSNQGRRRKRKWRRFQQKKYLWPRSWRSKTKNLFPFHRPRYRVTSESF